MNSKIQTEKQEDFFDFIGLPTELKCKIVDLCTDDPQTFCSLLQVSKSINKFCIDGGWKVCRHIPEILYYDSSVAVVASVNDKQMHLHDVSQPHVKLYASLFTHKDTLDNLRCWRCIQICSAQQFCADELKTQSVTCNRQYFQHQIDVLQIKTWISIVMVPKNLLNGLRVHSAIIIESDCDDEALLNFHAKYMVFQNAGNRLQITDTGLNKFMKQWIRGDRDIKSLDLSWDLSERNIDNILDGITVNVVWSPDDHENSLLGHIPIEIIMTRMLTNGMDHIYSIFNSRNFNDYRILKIGESTFKIESPPQTETGLLNVMEQELFRF